MKSLYLSLFGFSIILLSCSSSYKSMQTIDDVYYSPAVNVSGAGASQSNDGYVTTGSDNEDYVSVQGNDDINSYGYRNDVQEDWAIRRGIWNPLYRNSFSLSFGLGGYYNNYMDPFYSPFGSPFLGYSPFSYGYNSLWSPYYGGFGSFGYLGMFPYNNYFSPWDGYSGYYPYYGSHGLYSGLYSSPYNRIINNGPRVVNLGTPRSGVNTPIRGSSYPAIAPIRTLRSNNGNQIGTIERSANTGRNNVVTPKENRSNRRLFRSSQRNNDYYTPSRSAERRSEPSRPRDINPAPNRTFERNVPSVERTPSAPSAPRTSSPSSAPVRKF